MAEYAAAQQTKEKRYETYKNHPYGTAPGHRHRTAFGS